MTHSIVQRCFAMASPTDVVQPSLPTVLQLCGECVQQHLTTLSNRNCSVPSVVTLLKSASQACELAMDRAVGLPRGFAYVEYVTRADAERAKLHMDGGQLDGNVITCGPMCSSQTYVTTAASPELAFMSHRASACLSDMSTAVTSYGCSSTLATTRDHQSLSTDARYPSPKQALLREEGQCSAEELLPWPQRGVCAGA